MIDINGSSEIRNLINTAMPDVSHYTQLYFEIQIKSLVTHKKSECMITDRQKKQSTNISF